MVTGDLTRLVEEALRWDPALESARLEVIAADGSVTLRGTARSVLQKQRAERIARSVRGVREVTDEIAVAIPPSLLRDDRDLEEIARQVLEWHSQVPADQITVVAEEGVLTLTGAVDWQYQKRAAESAVGSLGGVAGVISDLRVRPTLEVRDVEKEIRRALHRSAELDAERIHVRVEGGKVILRGVVRSWSEIEVAESAAWAASGVTEVESHLRSDEELAGV